MSTIFPNWYNAQATRRYPLDDTATGTGDDGARIRDDVIVDLHLRWPREAGQYAFLAGLTVTPRIVTAVIVAADSPTTASNPIALAAVTLPQPVTRYRHYSLEALYPGTGGFIAFDDVTEACALRFGTPIQGLISPKSARPYNKLPIPSMRKFGRVDGLTGLVRLLGETDIEVVSEQVTYAGELYDAIVVRLVAPTLASNVLVEYSGPCSGRPESRSCVKNGVETINGIAPDCTGNIVIDFRGFTEGPYAGCGSLAAGVTLDQSVGLTDVCDLNQTPGRFTGVDDCGPSESASVSSLSSSISESQPELPSQSSLSSEPVICDELPFSENFPGSFHTSWIQPTGDFVFLAPGPGIRLSEPAQRQVLIWQDCGGASPLDKRVTCQVQLTNTVAVINGGLVLNYKPPSISNPFVTYFTLFLNRNNNRVVLARFNGEEFVTEQAVEPPLPFSLDEIYSLQVDMLDFAPGQVAFDCQVTNPLNPLWIPVTFTLLTSRFVTNQATYNGIGNFRSVTDFFSWTMADA